MHWSGEGGGWGHEKEAAAAALVFFGCVRFYDGSAPTSAPYLSGRARLLLGVLHLPFKDLWHLPECLTESSLHKYNLVSIKDQDWNGL